ncbi:MAG: hypothetical protein JW808_08445 [Victivallales bacterium]|nr:hypothetical protein [Victivallales bacterium]
MDTQICPRLKEGQEVVELGEFVVLNQALGGGMKSRFIRNSLTIVKYEFTMVL